jgi:hypothetical protein
MHEATAPTWFGVATPHACIFCDAGGFGDFQQFAAKRTRATAPPQFRGTLTYPVVAVPGAAHGAVHLLFICCSSMLIMKNPIER